MRKLNHLFILILLACCMLFGFSTVSYAAEGKLSIAVSKESVSVGDTVTVTLHAAGPNGEAATSSMEFTYDSSVFSFVSCDSSNYSGGEGGTVKASGETVKVTLKAVASGTCRLNVSAASGTVKSSQEALSGMVAAGASIKAGDGGDGGTKSGDNSLAELSLSFGELSPAFVYNVTEYTATVPYEAASLEVNARPSNSKAEIESIQGSGELSVGENIITVTVKAENGAKAVYTIKVTRQEGTGTPPEGADPNGAAGPEEPNGTGTEGTVSPEGGQSPAGGDAPATNTPLENGGSSQGIEPPEIETAEYEQQLKSLKEDYQELEKKFKKQKTTFYIIFAVMLVLLLLLGIVCVNLFLFRKRGRDMEDEEDVEWYDDEEIEAEEQEMTGESPEEELPVGRTKEKSKRTFWKRKKEDRWYDEDDDGDEDLLEHWEPEEEERKNSEEIEIIDMDDL